MKKKILVATILLFLFGVSVQADGFVNTKDYVDANVPAAIVIDAKTHRVLYEKNAYTQRNIASLTKVMTSIMLVENCKLDEVVAVPDQAVWIGGSELGLKKGDTITARNLLYGMLLPSGNDAAYTTGIHIGGTIERFGEMMTKKAQEIGALQSQFKNAHGLDVEGHYSTAYDMALITAYALKHKVISDIVSTKSATVSFGKTTKTLNNTNRLLSTYPYTDGVKTGYTSLAERCLIASATKDDFQVIAVVLGAGTSDIRFNTGKKLLDETLKRYTQKDLSDMMKWYVKIPIVKGEQEYFEMNYLDSMHYPIIEEEIENIYIKQDFIKEIVAPMSKNTYIGTIKMYLSEEEIYTKDIFLEQDIVKKSVWGYFKEALQCIFKKTNFLDLNWIDTIKYKG